MRWHNLKMTTNNVAPSLRVNMAVDLVIFVAAAIGIGAVFNQVSELKEQVRDLRTELRATNVTDARVVRIEEQQKYLVQKVDETNQLLRSYIAAPHR